MSGLADDSNSLNSTAKANLLCVCVGMYISLCLCMCIRVDVWICACAGHTAFACACVSTLCVCVSVSVLTAKKPQQHLTWQLSLLSVQLSPSGSFFCDTIFSYNHMFINGD